MNVVVHPILKSPGHLFRVPPEEREAILEVLCEGLMAQPDVAFAYVHGSFVTERPFHDVDVAVYLRVGEGAGGQRAMRLGDELEGALSRTQPGNLLPPVDVRILNEAPFGFCYQVLRRGRLLFSRDEELRVPWVVWVLERYLDLRPLRLQALKEAMAACH